jgi:hypothetical protein
MKNILILSILFFIGCKKNADIPKQFNSYIEAQYIVQSANLSIQEEAQTGGRSENNWIREAKYFANDKNSGYLIINMNGKDYIFDELPYSVWEQFKNAEDLGTAYHRLIKGKYNLKLKR